MTCLQGRTLHKQRSDDVEILVCYMQNIVIRCWNIKFRRFSRTINIHTWFLLFLSFLFQSLKEKNLQHLSREITEHQTFDLLTGFLLDLGPGFGFVGFLLFPDDLFFCCCLLFFFKGLLSSLSSDSDLSFLDLLFLPDFP